MKKIVKLVEEGRIPVYELGFFDIVVPIVEIDYPRCFIAKNNNLFYAFTEIENSDDFFGWNVARINLIDINEVNSGRKSVQSLFLSKEKFTLLFKNSDIGEMQNVVIFEGKYSIKGNLFVRDFCDMDSDFDYHNFALDAKKENSLKLSVVFRDEGTCSTGLILSIINYFKSLCKNLTEPLLIDNSKFFVKNNSTVITFSFDDSCGPLIKREDVHSTLLNGINELGNFLGSTKPVDLIGNLDKKNNLLIKKYEKLVESFGKTRDSRPKVVISTPDKEKPVAFVMDKASVKIKKKLTKDALTIVNSNTRKDTERIERDGLLTGIITGKGNFFKFDATTKEIFTGSVDFSIVGVKQFDVNGTKYHAVIEKTSLYSQANKLLDASCKLISLVPIERNPLLKQGHIEGLD